MIVGWLAEIGTGHYFWSGEGQLVFDGNTYTGSHFVTLSPAEATVGAPRKRMTASFRVFSADLRAAVLQDPGPLPVEINWIYSTDQGQSWTRLPRKFVGRLSSPTIQNGIYTIEIETYGGDVDRGRPLKWSDEDQQDRAPGDKGLEYMRQLASGIDTRWPP